MGVVKIELCSETGICSIIKDGAYKVDLISPEVDQIRVANGDAEVIKAVIGECDSLFASSLDADDIESIVGKLN